VRTATRRHVARPRPAERLGNWRLERLLGQGRWTQVFQARPAHGSEYADYAVKRLKAEYEQDPAAGRQLRQEARVARDVEHPHLISVLAARIDAPPFYIVTPYAGGGTLGNILSTRKRLATPLALWFARQLAEALQALHQQGWLHTDVKPDNVLVAVNGHATLCDLGNARPSDSAGTGQKMLAGTPAYLAPEAYTSSNEWTAASDIFSLGVTLYQMVTGQLPYSHKDPAELANAVLNDRPPDPRRIVPQISPRVARLLRTMLAKNALRRPTGSELIDWLVDLEITSFDERVA
jgi:serine/threonine protein kinase